MDKLTQKLQVIATVYPELPLRSARLHDKDGQFNDLVIINEEFIFRFPRYAEGIKTLQNEVRILNRIQNRLPIPIPNPAFTHFDNTTPSHSFLGYRMLPGKPLWRETIQNMKGKTIRQLGEQLARFLHELHNIPIQELDPGLPAYDHLEEWIELYAEFRKFLYPLMRPDACKAVSLHFEGYIKDPSLPSFQPALRHGDFGAGNLLINTEHQTLCGVIDLSFAGIGDPAMDIAAVSTLEPRLFAHFQQIYANIAPLSRRATFYKGTYALQEALHGLKNGDPKAFESGIASYR
jgi:aminoglycoside 2''-phosphotransferase